MNHGKRSALSPFTLLFALTYGSWRYAVEANPYPMTLTGLLLALLPLAQPTDRTVRHAIHIGLATAMASLFTLSGVLVAPAVLSAFWHPTDRRHGPSGNRHCDECSAGRFAATSRWSNSENSGVPAATVRSGRVPAVLLIAFPSIQRLPRWKNARSLTCWTRVICTRFMF